MPNQPRTSAPGPGATPAMGQLRRRKKYRLRRRTYALTPAMPEEGLDLSDPQSDALREQLAKLEGELKAAQDELKESNERVLRARADMENQRRRHTKEKDDQRKFATEELMNALVSPMDHFELALQSLETATTVDSVRQGVTMIHREFQMVLGQAGLEALDPIGKPFDPAQHDAVATDSDPERPDGVVTAVMRLGWALNGRVLRPAMVKVNKLETAPAGNGGAAPT